MKEDPTVFLKHILESIAYLELHIRNVSYEEFLGSVTVQDAVVRRLEVIGEAVRHLPDDLRRSHSDIPWNRPVGMRNILIHEYFGVDLDLVWATATQTIPEFKKQIEDLLQRLETER